MVCKKCKHTNVTVQTVSEVKKRGFLKILLYIFLALTIVGLIFIVVPMMRGQKTQTVKYCVCNDCGYSWKIR